MFSARLPVSLQRNRLTRLLERMRRERAQIVDLTVSNPADVGLPHDEAALGSALAQADVANYRAHPRGLGSAREAVSAAIGRRYPAEQLLLTSSTSEAYGYLFKLLCAPGDTVLVPRPSYPLFEHLTALDGVEVQHYRLHYAGGWQIDPNEVEALMGPRVKAVLAVSPNNPTGNYLAAAELDALSRVCGDRAALIVDEVFYEYPLRQAAAGPPAATVEDGLVFGLGGLSKLAGLPQLKLAWIGVSGDRQLRQQAISRLELIADAYLSVSTPVQRASAALLEQGRAWRATALERIRANRRSLQSGICAEAPQCTVLAADGGWTAVVRVPAVQREEELVESLLREQRVLMHPGYFYDFEREAYLVLSLLVAPETLACGLERLMWQLAKLR